MIANDRPADRQSEKHPAAGESQLASGSDAAGRGQVSGSRLPLGYLLDFLRFLDSNRDLIEVITYDDLPWDGDFDYLNSYPIERASWEEHVEAHGADKIYVLLQHDVDTWPERTLEVLRHEEAMGLRSNVMVFRRRHDRKVLRKAGALEYTPYEINVAYLQHLERDLGFVIGYHTNAVEQSLWDLDAAPERFADDLRELRESFDIRYFSPHGGVSGPDGENNNHIQLPERITRDVRWVHNRNTVRFESTYSDGGINNPKRNIEERDLRDFVRTWQPGRRYRVLVHPQYYTHPSAPAENLSHAAWYREVHGIYHRLDPETSAWDGVNREFRDRHRPSAARTSGSVDR